MNDHQNDHQSSKDSGRMVLPQRWMIPILVLLVVAIAGILIGTRQTATTSKTAPVPKFAEVSISASGFTPSTLAITEGTVVVWTNQESGLHQVASNNQSFTSQQLGSNAKFQYQLSTPGTYQYHDALNPSLNGTIVVKPSSNN